MRISILDHRLEKRLSCTQSFVPCPIFIFIFILLRLNVPFFIIHQHDSNHQLFLSNWGGAGGIFNMVWNPHSSLAGCSAGCYAIIFAHFAELGTPRGDEVGRDWQLPLGDTQVASSEPARSWMEVFLGPERWLEDLWTFNFMTRSIRGKVGGGVGVFLAKGFSLFVSFKWLASK